MLKKRDGILSTTEIKSVNFSILGTEDILNLSSVSISSIELLKNSQPYPGGLCDLHLGTTDHSYLCKTCLNEKEDCLGHSGHLRLNYPVYSPMFLGELRKWLRLICFTCGKPIILASEYTKYSLPKRLSEASKIAKSGNHKCVHCGEPHPLIKKEKKDIINILLEYFTDEKRFEKLYPHQVKTILEKISDDTVIELGKSPKCHPRKFVLDVINVPPTNIRPDDKQSGDKRPQNNHLTTLLKHLIKANEKIPNVFETINLNLESLFYDLNAIYYKLIKGGTNVGKSSIKTNTQLNSIAMRLKGKQGRFRKTQLGKRVHRCARSTIINNPRLKVDEVGVPILFAKVLQIEETVQEYNKYQMMIYFKNGRSRYPGCSKIYQAKTGTYRSVENISADFILEIGDRIYRDLINGDYVLFNRQPSLWPATIGAHRAVIIEDENNLAIQMNVLACPWYNADFNKSVGVKLSAEYVVVILPHIENGVKYYLFNKMK